MELEGRHSSIRTARLTTKKGWSPTSRKRGSHRSVVLACLGFFEHPDNPQAAGPQVNTMLPITMELEVRSKPFVPQTYPSTCSGMMARSETNALNTSNQPYGNSRKTNKQFELRVVNIFAHDSEKIRLGPILATSQPVPTGRSAQPIYDDLRQTHPPLGPGPPPNRKPVRQICVSQIPTCLAHRLRAQGSVGASTSQTSNKKCSTF
ncbi:hypothetical protein CPAR01_00531 [Colletotrichum paranaense]|uniref:Uncharacterized protein n=1 Tax=Colletotrichum paranaense TaxID=1914294 RepID=A0ABQ9T4Z9_9PEZI|nr:uncharacterized protein CPAR01_00531 [Colletotrichum paranaense]KAK1546564.1 hypothetical protein CPAR01_00531 [Colletotrichum paranaense]